MDSRYNRHNRRKYSLKVHIVLVIKYHKQLLKDSIADDVKQEILHTANTRGSSHRLKAVGGAYEKRKDLFMK